MTEPEKQMTEPKETESPEAQLQKREPEMPEEGFVPFAAEAAANKHKRKVKLLLLLLCAAVLFGVLLICSRFFGFYTRTMKHLKFDYRSGEAVSEAKVDDADNPSEVISRALGSDGFTAEANVYCFNSQAAISLTASHYRYEYTKDGADLYVRTGTDGGLFASSDHYHADSAGHVTKINWSKESPSDDRETANLSDYFFAVKPHGNVKLQRENSYYTSVNGTTYICELWLMESNSGGKTVYYTIYRYYQNDKLAGVRVLNSEDDLMMVYDITDYAAK